MKVRASCGNNISVEHDDLFWWSMEKFGYSFPDDLLVGRLQSSPLEVARAAAEHIVKNRLHRRNTSTSKGYFIPVPAALAVAEDLRINRHGNSIDGPDTILTDIEVFKDASRIGTPIFELPISRALQTAAFVAMDMYSDSVQSRLAGEARASQAVVANAVALVGLHPEI